MLLGCHQQEFLFSASPSSLETPCTFKAYILEIDIFFYVLGRTFWRRGLRFGVGRCVQQEEKGVKFPWQSWNNLALLFVQVCFPSTKSEKNINGHFRFSAHKLIWLMMLAEEHQLLKAHFAAGNPKIQSQRDIYGRTQEIYAVYVKHYMSWMIICLSCTSEQGFQKYTCCERHHKRKKPTMW